MRSFGAALGRNQPLLKAFRQVPDASSLLKSSFGFPAYLEDEAGLNQVAQLTAGTKVPSFAVSQEALRTRAPTPSSRQHCTPGDQAHAKAEPALKWIKPDLPSSLGIEPQKHNPQISL